MIFHIFGKMYLLVFPFQRYDARKLKKYEKDGIVDVEKIWIMRHGTLCYVSGIINSKGAKISL